MLTCEHAGRRVPPEQRALFAGAARELASHRGWDPGALDVAQRLARASGAKLLAVTTTRLLVDPNRSAHNPRVFSRYTRGLPAPERAALLERHHRPHWQAVRAAVMRPGPPVLHLAVHSFTPVLRGARRDFEIGLLYDPSRAGERALAVRWQRRLRSEGLRVRRNAPYRGTADGLPTALRRALPARRYTGFELELNQRVLARASQRRALAALLARVLLAETAP